MNNIEVGDYIRDCDGFIVKVNEIQDYKEDDDIWYEENTLKGTWKSMAVNHSKNIIDLIEVGDYVNGKLIHHTDIGKNYAYVYYGNGKTVTDYQIKSIVTKEQFEAIEYKIGG